MTGFFIGVYWYNRPATLREYANLTKTFLLLLRTVHPAFQMLQWVGDRPKSGFGICSDLGNLDELLLCHAGSQHDLYSSPNLDGTPSWNSISQCGFEMSYTAGKCNPGNDITVSIGAGIGGTLFPNSVVISFPEPDKLDFPYREFFDSEFQKRLFLEMNAFWQADEGLVTTHTFANAVAGDELPGVGWLTYLHDHRVTALRNDSRFNKINIVEVPCGGVLISLGPKLILPYNFEQIENARLLRNKLVSEKFISV